MVQLHPGATLTLEELREHCEPLIADYKIPRKLLAQTHSPQRIGKGIEVPITAGVGRS